MAGIYVHVPFCVSKCSYCDFYSVANLKKQQDYVAALKKEIEVRRYELEGQSVDTIYWGGGTPSLLSDRQVVDVMTLLRGTYNISKGAEITIECNPGDYNATKVANLIRSGGFNRFSIGAQSFSDKILAFLGRRHSVRETIEMYKSVRDLGVSNVSLDLIYGIPDTTLSDLNRDLDTLISLYPTHISAYHLIFEEGTPMTYALEQGRFDQLPEDKSLEMSHLVSKRLEQTGYEHYEVSNYSLPGMRSRHNSSYWADITYIGFGPSAHSYTDPWRSSNPADLDYYTESFLRHGFLLRNFEYITDDIRFEEYLMTRLRTSDGISLDTVRVRFGEAKTDTLAQRLSPFISNGLICVKSDGHLALTQAGIDISDTIISSLF
ncbi:radical SAM family heme chaperone HemW [Porphyromonas sp.]|uniref:radical SAM family heme chaperone HemW n=1 Tax=Porphyromonas sp. TaxID=1924944 RepID=UPI0026DAB2CB|nr:radical SAM family heme chaperone HemW [Porphyromonas sp.]MDO4695841.1 radical SAM family heme chaperone HemW [Porphyromonas sp.]MDO4771401.1 radical SAM family heme chaperone HemW [Porphyromonas sp.]